MFATVQDVKDVTGYEVTNEGLRVANYMVESYIGRRWAEVDGPRDLETLMRATAYQAAYLKNNSQMIFEQVDISEVVQNANIVTMRHALAPYFHRLAILNMSRVSWRGSRSIRTGTVFGRRR